MNNASSRIQRAIASLRNRLGNEPSGDDIDQMRAWSISSQLAAVPAAYLAEVPTEVASLIRAAQELHPDMARGAAERDARSEPCPQFG